MVTKIPSRGEKEKKAESALEVSKNGKLCNSDVFTPCAMIIKTIYKLPVILRVCQKLVII